MKLWIDDVRPAPEGYIWCKSVKAAKDAIETRELLDGIHWHYGNGTEEFLHPFELIDMDHDAGDYVHLGGDYIKLLDWLEETGRNYPIRIHSMNPVGRENMRAIIRRNGWMEVM
jgi:hypothetical protein